MEKCADDTVILGENKEDMTDLLRKLKDEIKNWVQTINFSKTE